MASTFGLPDPESQFNGVVSKRQKSVTGHAAIETEWAERMLNRHITM